MRFLDASPTAPASVAASQVLGSFADAAAVDTFAVGCDVLTVEVEHVDASALEHVEQAGRVLVVPCAAAVRLIQDKLAQKEHFRAAGVPLPSFTPLSSAADLAEATFLLGFPLLLKSRRGAYDGRGNATAHSREELPAALASLGGESRLNAGELYAEAWAPFTAELAVMCVRSAAGELVNYPLTETVHSDHICSTTLSPAPSAYPFAAAEALRVARLAVASLPGAGVFGVELFLLANGRVLLNEVAPRPHNSGHFSIDACVTCQYENALRACLGWPLGDAGMTAGAAMMVNLLGSGAGAAAEAAAHRVMGAALATPGAAAHWYGKSVSLKRKIGHVTLCGPDVHSVRASAQRMLAAAAAGDDVAAAGGSAGAALAAMAEAISASVQSADEPRPLVGVIMGSDSDLPCMAAACDILRRFRVPFEVTIVSAHRTPQRLLDYASSACGRGMRCVIAGAGGAAHLPGMVASLTPLPVIGVPVPLRHLDGVDSLLSIIQMPKGVPVATVAVGNAENAGLLAVRVLAAGGGAEAERLRGEMEAFQATLRDGVLEKAARLEAVGWEAYLGRK